MSFSHWGEPVKDGGDGAIVKRATSRAENITQILGYILLATMAYINAWHGPRACVVSVHGSLLGAWHNLKGVRR